ncbi:MmcQ/YjbR family DNA-binding protein [Periweissella cryptocerci]|uniref:MmcQ/YjbR family DNA-binding protein n=2 Tax=Periweissella cryptocerci TaxID=2506420 RepID=A0A4P6YXC6_9LACO|nr:MmcQ/YjbR family DNA-binding protein [Periweissella cryptocerci]
MKRIGDSLPGAHVRWRIDWECWYFDLDGKMFGLMHDSLLTLKGDPQQNEIMREEFAFVIAGYHVNKTHWNSIRLTESTFTIAGYEKLIKASYDLVMAGFSHKKQLAIQFKASGSELESK